MTTCARCGLDDVREPRCPRCGAATTAADAAGATGAAGWVNAPAGIGGHGGETRRGYPGGPAPAGLGATPYDNAPGPRPMTLADTKAAKLRIPYLGPEPPPSRPLRRPVQVAAVVAAGLYVVRGGLYLQRADLDQQGLDRRLGLAELTERITSNQGLLNTVNRFGLLTVALLLVLDVIWRWKRRPPDVKRRLGEAYVESPVVWVLPTWYRLVCGVLIGVAVFASISGTVSSTTRALDLPGHRALTALGSIMLAAFWIVFVLVPHWADRVHDERMAWSGPYRDAPATVPYFPPLAALDTGSGSTVGAAGAGGGAPGSVTEGPMWFLTTAGVILLLFVAVIIGIASVGDLLSPRGNPVVDLAWLAGAMAALAFVVWVFVRRYRRNHAAGGAPDPEGPWYG